MIQIAGCVLYSDIFCREKQNKKMNYDEDDEDVVVFHGKYQAMFRISFMKVLLHTEKKCVRTTKSRETFGV